MIYPSRLRISCLCVSLAMFSIGIAPEEPMVLYSDLTPESPEMYFNIGELLIAETADDSHILLGTQFLAIGVGLASRQDQPELAASMCIALAWSEPDAKMAASLWDFALMLDPNRYSAWVVHRNARLKEQAVVFEEAAQCVYAARFNDPKRASELLARRDILRALQDGARQAGLDPVKIHRLLESMINDSHNDDCRGRVFITERSEGQVRRVVCQDHTRPIGSSPNEESLRMLIKLELVLLDGLRPSGDAPWATIAYLQLSEPAREPSLSQIADYYNINYARPYRRDDRWTSSP
ncbi:hypothetical protein COB72_01480 [bacterium]|nr:MAG: hypothetical protein COB72_01480 [bacterium]